MIFVLGMGTMTTRHEPRAAVRSGARTCDIRSIRSHQSARARLGFIVSVADRSQFDTFSMASIECGGCRLNVTECASELSGEICMRFRRAIGWWDRSRE